MSYVLSHDPLEQYDILLYPHTMPKARVTITIPEELLAAADRRARELDRSRSWVIADTLQRGLSSFPNCPRWSTDGAPRAGSRRL